MASLTPHGRSRTLLARMRSSGDAGITLIELMAALLVFGIAATGLMAGFISTAQKTRLDKDRVAAANLAARELEITRNDFNASASAPLTIAATPTVTNGNPLPGGTVGAPLVVDKVPYTVSRRVSWVPTGNGQSACDGGSSATYPTLAVQVTVTWPYMGAVKPVEANTLMTPPKGVVSSNTGFVAVKVVGTANQPQENIPVTMTGPGGTVNGVTADDGCAVLATATAGTYTAGLSKAGWVDFYGASSPTKSVTVSQGSIFRTTFNYDQAATMQLALQTQAGYSLPTGLRSATLANTGLQPTGTAVKTVGASGTATLSSLWPFVDGYTVWAGSCAQSDPAAAGGSRDSAVVIPPGGTVSASSLLAPVAIAVTTSTAVPVPNATVTATPVSTSGCATTENPLTLGVTDVTGRLNTSLPAGAWEIQVSGRTSPGWPTTPTLLPTSAPTSVAVTVL